MSGKLITATRRQEIVEFHGVGFKLRQNRNSHLLPDSWDKRSRHYEPRWKDHRRTHRKSAHGIIVQSTALPSGLCESCVSSARLPCPIAGQLLMMPTLITYIRRISTVIICDDGFCIRKDVSRANIQRVNRGVDDSRHKGSHLHLIITHSAPCHMQRPAAARCPFPGCSH